MNREIIQNHMAILIQIVRCIHLKKALTEVDPKPDLNFWRLIHGGFLDLAVMEWCKIFGSNAEYTHWKTLLHEDDHDNFRNNLFEHLNIKPEEWDKNWVKLKTYRDELVAHHNRENDVPNYPTLDIALTSSCYYYNYLAKQIHEENSDPMPDLESYCDRFHQQAIKIATEAVAATKKYSENVY